MEHETALITGSSGGIGKEMAKKLFSQGYNLVLTSRNFSRLEKAKKEIQTLRLEGKIDILPIDLSLKESSQRLWEFTQSKAIEIGVLINNAGAGMYGCITELDFESLEQMLNLNTRTLTELCAIYGKAMTRRKKGKILNIASLAAYQPVPYISAYAASKAYVLNFSESIAMELEDYQVQVTCFSPGHTETNFFASAQISDDHKFYGTHTRVNPKEVAQSALDALFAGKISAIHGRKNRFLSFLSKISPRKTTARISKKMVG